MRTLLALLCCLQDDAEYLILTHDSFAETVRPLAEWKRQKGYRTRIAKLSEISAKPTADEIRGFLKKARPAYVLLVGDAQLMPPASIKRKRRILTDHYYGCLGDGDDWHPDAYVGRLPCSTPEEAAEMVRKILVYEKTPEAGAYGRAAVAAEFEDHDNDGYENGGFLEATVALKAYLAHHGVRTRTAFQRKADSTALPLRHAKKHTGEWDLRWAGGDVIKGTWGTQLHFDGIPYVEPVEFLPDAAAVRRTLSEAVNEGVGVVQFNLHGGEDRTVFPEFTKADVQKLANGPRLPVVTIFACSTGTFSREDCFAEEWLKNPKGGAVAVIASSGGSWGTYNEWLSHGLWNSRSGDYLAHLATLEGYRKIDAPATRHGPDHRLGPMLAGAKMALLELYREETQREWLTRDTFETYVLLGDPELELRLGPQVALSVSVRESRGRFEVRVRRDGAPVVARIGLVRGDAVVSAVTDKDGAAAIPVPNGSGGTITVTARDSIPWQKPLE